MAHLHIVREHTLGLAAARQLAQAWARDVEDEFELRCRYEAGRDGDRVRFERTGVRGMLQVTPTRFELEARLGALLGLMRGRIETEITRRLDERLAARRTPPGPRGQTGPG